MSLIRLKDALSPRSNSYSPLANLIGRIEYQSELRRILGEFLPEKDAAHVIGGSIRGTTLVLLIDSAAWATRLRFQTRDLLRSLQSLERFAKIERIVLQIDPASKDRRNESTRRGQESPRG